MTTHRIPLRGKRTEGRLGKSLRGLVIRSSDCEDFAPPPQVNELHREIQQEIDRRKVKDGEEHGWIEHDGDGNVVDYDVDEELL